MNWQPLPAPRDRTVLVYNGPKARYRVCTARYHERFGWQSSPGGWPCSPKMWAEIEEPQA